MEYVTSNYRKLPEQDVVGPTGAIKPKLDLTPARSDTRRSNTRVIARF